MCFAPPVFRMDTLGIMLILNDGVFLSRHVRCRGSAVTPSSATFMCHLSNKASGRGNSQPGSLAGVLGDVSGRAAPGIVCTVWVEEDDGEAEGE